MNLAVHRSALRAKSKAAWNNKVGKDTWQLVAAWSVAGVCALAALLSISLLAHYQGTIAYASTTNTVDRYGQVVGKHVDLGRTSLDAEARGVVNSFVLNAFRVVNSKMMMQSNAAAAQSFICSDAKDARSELIGYWATHSPLGADASWTEPQAEVDAQVTSKVKRGEQNGEQEWLVEWTTQTVGARNERSPFLLWQADMTLAQGAPSTDDNIGGLCITHLSISQVH
jgi:hypothetical protein